jgi:tRNA pseudouridine55 synthase
MLGFEGALLVDKPSGMTSHDVVQAVRQKLSLRKVGHTGTLDPMAEGLLVVLVGPATKHQQAFQGHDKTYEAVLRLGVQTDTGDATGTPIREAAIPVWDRTSITEVLSSFRGSMRQTPPAYSAVKVRGHPAYWWARRHQPIALAPRTVHVFEVTLVDCDSDAVTFRVHCSAGTYIRSLAEAFAERLGTVGHLARLVRLHIGHWSLEQAHPLSWVVDVSSETLAGALLPICPTDLMQVPRHQ